MLTSDTIPLTKIRKVAFWAIYHEELFQFFFKWEAVFSELRKVWVWNRPPSEDGQPVNARYFDTTSSAHKLDNCSYQPSVMPTSHGNLLQVGDDTISFPQYSYHIDPLIDVKCTDSYDGEVYGGIFLAPPDYQAKLFVNQIKNGR